MNAIACGERRRKYVDMKKHHRIVFANGEEMTLAELDSGTFGCPICGTPWPYPPRAPVERLGETSAPAFGDVCDGCGVEFGVDEGCAPYAPTGWMRRQYAEFRTLWLDRGGWSAEQLAQLEGNIGISELQARADAQRLRSGSWNL